MKCRSGFVLNAVLFLLGALIVGGCLASTILAAPQHRGEKAEVLVTWVGGEYAEIEVEGVLWRVPVPGTGSVAYMDPPDPLRLQIAGGVLASLYGDPTWRNVDRKSWSDHFITIGYPREVAAEMADVLGGMIALARTNGLYEAAGGS